MIYKNLFDYSIIIHARNQLIDVYKSFYTVRFDKRICYYVLLPFKQCHLIVYYKVSQRRYE